MPNKFKIKRGSVAPTNSANIDNYELVYNYTDNELWTKHNGSVVQITSNTSGTVTNVVTENGISGGPITSTGTIGLNFSTLTDMTGDISGTTEFILQNGTVESRKAASEIKLTAFDATGFSIAGAVDTSGTPIAQEYARFTDANTIEGRSAAGVRTDLGLVVGTNVQAQDTLLQDIADFSTSNAGNDGKVVTYQDSDGSLVLSTPSAGTITGVTGMTNNNVLTASGSTTISGESSLTFDGAALNLLTTTANRRIEIGLGATQDVTSFVDLIGDTTYTDYGGRFIRYGGANAITQIMHRGTGSLRLLTQDSAPIDFLTASAVRARISSSGNMVIGSDTAYTTGGTPKLSLVGGGLNLGAGTNDMSYIRRIDTGDYQWQTWNGNNDGQIHLQPYGGNVGIGVTNPASELHIGAGDGNRHIKISDNRAMFGYYGNCAVVQGGNTKGIKFNTGTDTFGSNTRMTITSAGNVGIGTNSPTQDLTIFEDSGDCNVLISSANGASQVFFGDDEDDNIGIIRYDHGSNFMKFTTNTGDAMTIDSSQRVGIGTSSPSKKFVVKGASGDQARFEHNGAVGAVDIYSGTDGGLLNVRNASGTSVISLDARNSRNSYYNHTGNFGIGTTSPSLKLDVAGDIGLKNNATYLYSKDASGTSTRMFGINGSNNTYIGPIDNYAGGSILYGANANVTNQIFYTGGAERVRIESGGDFGIGTNNPQRQLHVKGNDNEVVVLESADTHTDIIGMDSVGSSRLRWTSGIFQFYTGGAASSASASGGTFAMEIDANQRVGIGTSSPSGVLHLYGTSGTTQQKIQTTDNASANIRYQNNAQSFVVGINAADQYTWYSTELAATTNMIHTNGDFYTYYDFLISNNNRALEGRDTAGNITNLIKIDNQNAIRLGDTTHVDQIAISTSSTTNAMVFNTNGTIALNGNVTMSSPFTVNYGAVINEGGHNSDFRVESENNANMLKVDASADAVLTEKLIDSATHLGTVGGHGLEGNQLSTTDWANLPVGFGGMMRSGNQSYGNPGSNYFLFHKIANRDSAGGWGGIALGYNSNADFYVGHTTVSGSYATWSKVWNEANDGAGSGLDADNLDGTTWTGTDKTVRWDNGRGYHGNPRSMAIGYSGGNYGQFGYNIDFTTTSNQHNYAFNDIASRCDLYDGLQVYTSVSGGSAGSAISWTELLRVRNGAFNYKGHQIWHANNDGSGSGLDADTVDGIQASSFLRSDATDTATGALTFGTQTWNGHITWNAGKNIYVAGESSFDVSGSGVFQIWDSGTGAPFIMCDVGNRVEIGQAGSRGLKVHGDFDPTGTHYVRHGGSDYSPNISFLGGSNVAGSNAYENATIGYYDNSGTGLMRFGINRTGASNYAFYVGTTRSVIMTSTYLAVPDGAYLAAGNDNDIFIRHDGNGHLQSNAGTMFINQVANGSMILSTNNTERIRIEGGGDVGINCTNPPFQLKVNVTNGTYTDMETIAGFQSKRGADTEYEAGIMINSMGDCLGGSISSNLYWTDNTMAKGNTGRSGGAFQIDNSASNESQFLWRGTPYNSTTLTNYMMLDNTQSLHVDADVVAYSSSVSDERLKDNIKTIPNALDKVMQLRGVEFDWNATSRKGNHDIGVIAQEVEKVLPEIVKEHTLCTGEFTNNEKEFKTVDYDKMIGVLIEAIKEQQVQIDELKTHIGE